MKKSKGEILIRIVQIIISLAAIFFVVYKLIQFNEWTAFYEHIDQNHIQFWFLLTTLIFLSFLTLALEGLKWQQLISLVYSLKFSDALFQILKGLQGGIVTPARLGDPPSRAMHLPKEFRSKSLLLSVMGIMIQNLTIGTGAILGLLFLNKAIVADASCISQLETAVIKYAGILVLLIITGQVLLLIGTRFLKKFSLIRKITSFFLIVKDFKLREVLNVILLTILKYSVFCFQFWLILFYFEIITDPSHIALVAIYFGAITLLPTFAIADLGLRGSIAILLFGLISFNSLGIVMSVFLLWCLNTAMPAMIPFFWKNKVVPIYSKETIQ